MRNEAAAVAGQGRAGQGRSGQIGVGKKEEGINRKRQLMRGQRKK